MQIPSGGCKIIRGNYEATGAYWIHILQLLQILQGIQNLLQ